MPSPYEEEAERRYAAGLSVSGEWTFIAKDRLKAGGFLWHRLRRCWCAPSASAKAEAERQWAEADVARWSVTVHGDGGWKNGTGRWAWYCKTSGEPPILGRAEGPTSGPGETEANALCSGLRVSLDAWGGRIEEAKVAAEQRGLVAPAPLVFLRSDCLNLLKAIEQKLSGRNRSLPSGWRYSAVYELLDLHRQWALSFNIKHVKGHGDPSKSTAAWVNWKVDAMSSMRGT